MVAVSGTEQLFRLILPSKTEGAKQDGKQDSSPEINQFMSTDLTLRGHFFVHLSLAELRF